MRPDVDVIGLQLPDSRANFFDTASIPDYIRTAKESFPEQFARIEEQLRSEQRQRG